MRQAAPASFVPAAVPSARGLIALVCCGLAATGFFEIWANVPTALLAGIALEPPELIKSLFAYQLGLIVPDVWAKALHYLTGILFYPLGYWLISRVFPRLGAPADGWLWGVVTYFLALGVFAPLAGLPFLLLGDGNVLSLMSLIGHALYGYLLGRMFEAVDGL